MDNNEIINTLDLKEMGVTHKSKSYWKNTIWNYEDDYPHLAEVQNKFLEAKVYPLLNKNMHICELACAEGTYTRKTSPYVGSIDAYDLSEKMIDLAKEKTKACGITNIAYYCEDLTKRVEKKSSYDTIIALGLFTCIINDFTMQQIVEQMVESIPSGGYLVLKDTLATKESFTYESSNYAAKYRSTEDYMCVFEKHRLVMIDKNILIRGEDVYSLWCILKKP